MIELKNNDVLIWKGVEWFKLLKFDKRNISRLFIQLFTLSRYTHTAIFIKIKNREFIFQSNLIDGVHIVEVTNESWIKNNIKNNSIDLYRSSSSPELNFLFRMYKDVLINIIDFQNKNSSIEKIKIKFDNKYNIKGILEIGIFNVIGIYNFNKKSIDILKKKFFCSELTMYIFTSNLDVAKYSSPFDVHNSNMFNRIH
jgi:hypothetical protein